MVNLSKYLIRESALGLGAELAGVQLYSANAGLLPLAEALTFYALRDGSPSKKERCSRKALWKLLNEADEAAPRIRSMCDPPSDVFTTYCSLFDVPVRFLQCLNPGLAQTLESVCRALARLPRRDAPINRLCHELLAIGLLSECLVSRAQLRAELPGDLAGQLRLPPEAELSRLRTSTIFSQGALAAILEKYDCDPSALTAYETARGSLANRDYDVDGPVPVPAPLIREKDQVVVAFPHLLANFAYIQISRRLADSRFRDEVRQAIHGEIDRRASIFLSGFAPRFEASRSLVDLHGSNLSLYTSTSDLEKPFAALVLTDDFASVGPWPSSHVMAALERIISRLSLSATTSPITTLIIYSTSMRGFFLNLRKIEGVELFVLSSSELEAAVSMVDFVDPYYFSRFLSRLSRFRSAHNIHAPTFLSLLNIYQRHDNTFYLSDERAPGMIVLGADQDFEARSEIHRRRMPRAALAPDGLGHYVVQARHDAREEPVFSTFAVSGLYIPMNDSTGIWVIDNTHQHVFLDAVVFWLTELAEVIRNPVEYIYRVRCKPVVVSIQMANMEEDSPEHGATLTNQFRWFFDGESAMVLEIGQHVNRALADARENFADRHLVSLIVQGFRSGSSSGAKEEEIKAILERIAPIGPKTMIHAFEAAGEMDPKGLAPPVLVRPSDGDDLRGELGSYLAKELGIVPPASIPGANRKAVLDKSVEFFYSRLVNIASTWDREKLLFWAVSNDEALIRAEFEEGETFAAQVACYGTRTNFMEFLVKKRKLLWNTAVANRFLIEFLASLSLSSLPAPTPSHEQYVEAVACCQEIFNFGTFSELMEHELMSIDIEFLGSGRLGMDRVMLSRVFDGFLSHFFGESVWASMNAADLRMTNAPSDRDLPDFDAIDKRLEEEFGFSFSDQRDFVQVCMDIYSKLDGAFAVVEVELVRNRLASELSWSTSKIDSFLDQLTLKERQDFLRPDPGFSRADIYPWKFNRRLSYLRRPLLLRRDGRIWFGPRSVLRSLRYLGHLIYDGRLACKSKGLIAELRKNNGSIGLRFSRRIAEILARGGSGVVRHGVKKFSGRRLKDESGDLGDIDVLFVDRHRRSIYLIECKDFTIAKTARDIADSRRKLFVSEAGKRSKLELHIARSQWVSSNISAVCQELGLGEPSEWKVVPVIVVDDPMIILVTERSAIPVLTVRELVREVLGKDSL